MKKLIARAGILLILLSNAQAKSTLRRKQQAMLPPATLSLAEQNKYADLLEIPVIKTNLELHEMWQSGILVRLCATTTLRVHIPAGRDVTLPQTAELLADIAQDYYSVFGTPLQVNSATRPAAVQRHLARWNHNAAPWRGDVVSLHMRGLAVDLEKRRLSRAQRQWLAWHLFWLQERGLLQVTEEQRQPCFHIVALPTAGVLTEPAAVEAALPDASQDTAALQ